MSRRPATAAPARTQTAVAVAVLVGLEIALIALLTAAGITGTPAVITVIVFALVERVAYVRWFKRRR
ncbi:MULTISPECIES: hypothetical protein [unclassified Isoptericola]|uniref:hypothetical protein n=1 Tax=unclassified Isoptericola TaxID=2623355 RepID=UPI0036489420